MSWTIEERPNSRKFNVSDDGTARAVISLVCTDLITSVGVAGAPDSIWDALSTDWAIGTTPTVNDAITPAFSGKWKVESYSGLQPANGRGNVWYVDVSLSFSGAMKELQSGLPESYVRRDIEVMTGTVLRQAATFVDWYALSSSDMPTDGDADWNASSLGYLKIANSARVDVNGRPIIFKIPGQRITINMLTEIDVEGITNLGKNKVGSRNGASVLSWPKGSLVLESIESVQVGHGYQRQTYRLLADQAYHLEQEAAVTPMDNGSIFRSSETVIDSDVSVWHVEAVWRQPYALTTDKSWELSDLVPNADDRAYIEGLAS